MPQFSQADSRAFLRTSGRPYCSKRRRVCYLFWNCMSVGKVTGGGKMRQVFSGQQIQGQNWEAHLNACASDWLKSLTMINKILKCMSRAKRSEDSNCPVLLIVIGQGCVPILKASWGHKTHQVKHAKPVPLCVYWMCFFSPQSIPSSSSSHSASFPCFSPIPHKLWPPPPICIPRGSVVYFPGNTFRE